MSDAPPRGITAPAAMAITVACLAGAAAMLSAGVHPTGHDAIDAAQAVLAGALVALVTMRAPWIAAAIAAAAATLLAGAAAGAGLGVVAGLAAVMAGARSSALGGRWRHTPAVLRGIGGAAMAGALGRLHWPTTTAGPTAAALTITAVLLLAARRAQREVSARDASATAGRSRLNRAVTAALLMVAGGTAAASAAWSVSAAASRDDLETARTAAEAALDAVAAGRTAEAQSLAATVRDSFDRAHARMSAPWGRPAALVPVLAQHRRAALEMSDAGAQLGASMVASLELLRSGALTPRGGTVDLAAIDRAEPPIAAAELAAARLDDTVERTLTDPWIAQPLKRRAAALAPRVRRARRDTATGLLAVRAGRTLLGGDGPRRYVVLFMTPAEARGLGGHAGNFAELGAAGGRLRLVRFGRIGDLFPASGQRVRLTGTDEWRAVWGRLGGISGPGGTMEPDYWLNVTMPPDLPTVGGVVAELYPQVAGGAPVDGVMAVDPYGLSALLRLTGPVQVPTLGRTLDADGALGFLLRDQYREFGTNDRRVDMLESVSQATAAALLGPTTSLPDLPTLARIMSPAARGNHLTMWSRHEPEQRLLRRIGADHDFRAERKLTAVELDDATGAGVGAADDEVAVVYQNASKSKLDAFMTRTWTYDAELGPDGELVGTVAVELTNRAASTGLPPYVYGNLPADDPDLGVAVTNVVVYTSVPSEVVQLDGTGVAASTWQEHGRHATAVSVRTAPGATSRLVVRARGTTTARRTVRLVARTQTSGSEPDQVRVRVRRRDGQTLLDTTYQDRAVARWVIGVR